MPDNKTPETAEKSYGFNYIKEILMDIIDLRKGVDKQAAIDEIKEKKSMSGANAWMLMCSIIIASIGLDRDSDAVIIGAMLISPLMSPILGIGLGIGINDKNVTKKAFINFNAAVIIALLTSFIYFKLSPFGRITPAILARTAPDSLDIFIAIFGGLAGIISIARKDISTTLPGVAIATALMPPLCVTGFGLASGNWNYALNSFYLFILNASFISIATYVIVRYLRFPYKKYINPKERFRNRIVIAIYGLLIIIPSFIILGNVLQKVNTKNTIKDFVENSFGVDQIYMDSYMTLETDTSSTIVLKVYGESINSTRIPEYTNRLKSIGLENWDIKIIQSSEVNLNEIQSLEKKIREVRMYTEQENEARKLEQAKLLSIETDSTEILKIERELKTLYNDIESVSFSEMNVAQDNQYYQIPTCIIQSSKPTIYTDEKKAKLSMYLKERMNQDTMRVFISN